MTEVKKLEYIAFMCAAHHVNYDYLEETLKDYPIGLYLMAAEVTKDAHTETNGEHFHFLVQMSELDYSRYAKRCFKDKLKLRGQARDGNPRQYGKVKKVEDVTRMAAYTIKQGNIRTNMTEAQLAAYKAVTFVQKEQFSFEEELYEYMVAHSVTDNGNKRTSYHDLGVQVIEFTRGYKTKQYLNRNKIDKYIRFYQVHYLKDYLSAELLMSQM